MPLDISPCWSGKRKHVFPSPKNRQEFTRATSVYGEVADELAIVKIVNRDLGSGKQPSPEAVAEISKHLRAAQEAESRGLDMLAEIRKAL